MFADLRIVLHDVSELSGFVQIVSELSPIVHLIFNFFAEILTNNYYLLELLEIPGNGGKLIYCRDVEITMRNLERTVAN